MAGLPDILVASPGCIPKCLSAGVLQAKSINESLEILVLDEVQTWCQNFQKFQCGDLDWFLDFVDLFMMCIEWLLRPSTLKIYVVFTVFMLVSFSMNVGQ